MNNLTLLSILSFTPEQVFDLFKIFYRTGEAESEREVKSNKYIEDLINEMVGNYYKDLPNKVEVIDVTEKK